ncbi:hypothetical protein IW15_18090 [Chryseobacterium soli]|uniref:Uncharacterized protein n=1 Tax=Chryseobacterium soli TaxID=445961 RepID=A0A086A303_9FLAO|nr:hypothetical protein [Chryseobacterium soli]KFF11067.1 hypothetical protein IW15_18090 [Chryseobacterium soli]
MNKQQFTLKQIKETFLYNAQNMGLDEIDEDWAEELLAQRYYSEFENLWEKLSDDRSEISKDQYDQIISASKEISDKICEDLHHELIACICEDFELIATYLIAGENDKHIAGMLQSYINNEIPTDLSMKSTDKSLQEIFNEFQITVRISNKDKAKK